MKAVVDAQAHEDRRADCFHHTEVIAQNVPLGGTLKGLFAYSNITPLCCVLNSLLRVMLAAEAQQEA